MATNDAGKRLLGVLSDTHGLMRPGVAEAFRDVERILHAGDIGGGDVLRELRRIAPVTAVHGNVDGHDTLLATQVIALGGIILYLVHDLAQMDLDPAAVGIRVVVFGHSHHPCNEERDGILYFNPGSAGPDRFRTTASVGLLEIEGAQVRAKIIPLA